MKQFNMKDSDLKSVDIAKVGSELARDEQGRLYMAGMRALMEPLNVDTSAVEALAAIRVAGRSLRLLQERQQKVCRLHLLIAKPPGDLLGGLQGLSKECCQLCQARPESGGPTALRV